MTRYHVSIALCQRYRLGLFVFNKKSKGVIKVGGGGGGGPILQFIYIQLGALEIHGCHWIMCIIWTR